MSNIDLKPIAGQRASVEVFIPDLNAGDLGPYIKKVIFKGFINNGYAIRIQIKNPNFAILDGMFEGDNTGSYRLLERIRDNPIALTLKIKYEPGSGRGYPREETRTIKAYIVMIYPHGSGEIDYVEILAIDPLNFFFRIGDAFGGGFEGNISEVIRQLLRRYIPSGYNLTVPETRDSKANVWWMMRRAPRDVLSHWLHIASSLDESGTPWAVGMFNDEVKIGPISTFTPSSLGYYRKMDENGYGDIIDWEAVLNPSLGHHEMGLVTAGVTATLGQVYDQTNRPNKAIVSENNTENKWKPKQPMTGVLRSTIRPENATYAKGRFGRSFVESPPEYFSAGEIEVPYIDFFDAYARTEYVRHAYKMFTIDLKVKGHGVWDSTIGLGAVNVYVDWHNNFKDGVKNYFMSGNWLVYGFEHTWYENNWTTVLKLSKLDLNANAVPVGL